MIEMVQYNKLFGLLIVTYRSERKITFNCWEQDIPETVKNFMRHATMHILKDFSVLFI